MMEQRPWITPLVWSKLPRLACRHHAHYTLPSIGTKLLQCVRAVDDKVSLDGTTT